MVLACPHSNANKIAEHLDSCGEAAGDRQALRDGADHAAAILGRPADDHLWSGSRAALLTYQPLSFITCRNSETQSNPPGQTFTNKCNTPASFESLYHFQDIAPLFGNHAQNLIGCLQVGVAAGQRGGDL